MSSVTRTMVMWPLREPRWPDRRWMGCNTWVEGRRIFARIAANDVPSRPPIVMVHGLVVSGAYFRPIARYLDGYHSIYIPDLPGYGRSGPTSEPDLESQARMLDGWMEVHGLRQVHLVANSLGCQVATFLAHRYPDRVAKLIMVAPTMDPAVRGPIHLLWRGIMDIPKERASIWRVWIPDFFAYGPWRAIKGLFESLRDDQPERLPHIRKPVLAVAGECDPICPVSWVRQFASMIPNGRCEVIPRASHAMNYSSAAELGTIISRSIHAWEAELQEEQSSG